MCCDAQLAVGDDDVDILVRVDVGQLRPDDERVGLAELLDP